MKEIKELKTKAEEITKWEAIDGTIFSDKEECERYEESALCVIKARFNKLIVSKGNNAWDLMKGYDDHTVTVVKLNNIEDVNTVAQYLFLKCTWWSEEFRTETYNELEETFKNGDLFLIGYNCEDEPYSLGPRQTIINNLLNLDKDESSCSGN